MRSLSATLLTAQTSNSRKPYFRMAFLGGAIPHYVWPVGGSHDTCGLRLLSMTIYEYAYASGTTDYQTTMTFTNYDLSIPDLRGCYVDLGWGDVTSGGNEYATYPRMWVKHQENISSPSGITTEITLEGWAEALNEEHARVDNSITDPALYKLFDRDTTPYGIMSAILDADVSYRVFTLDALTVDDGIIDTFLPYFEINAERQRYESKLEIVYRNIITTKCYIKPLEGNHLCIVYPKDSDSIDLTIYSDTKPIFYKFYERLNEVLPNQVIVLANAPDIMPDDYSWPDMVMGYATDDDSVARYGKKIPYIIQQPYITTETDANNRASAILARMQTESVNQALVIPHHCAIELYDHLLVRDKRGRDAYNDTKVRVSGLTHTYIRADNTNTLTIYGGGLTSLPYFEDTAEREIANKEETPEIVTGTTSKYDDIIPSTRPTGLFNIYDDIIPSTRPTGLSTTSQDDTPDYPNPMVNP